MLAKLQGSEKQVKWAEDIRSKFLKGIEKNIANLEEDIEDFDMEEDKEKLQFIKKLQEEIKKEESATFFIDNRQSPSPEWLLDKVFPDKENEIKQLFFTRSWEK